MAIIGNIPHFQTYPFGFSWMMLLTLIGLLDSFGWHLCQLPGMFRCRGHVYRWRPDGQAQRWDGQRLRTLRSSSLSGTKRRRVMERETQHGARQRLRLFINYPHLPWFVQRCWSMVWSKCAVTVRKAVRPGLRRFKCLNPTFEILWGVPFGALIFEVWSVRFHDTPVIRPGWNSFPTRLAMV